MKVHLGNGMVAEVENENDLELLRKLTQSAPTGQVNGHGAAVVERAEHRPEPKPGRPSAEQVRDWRGKLGSESQTDLLQLLTKAPHGLTDEQLRGELKLQTNSQLAGVLGVMARNASAAGLAFETLVSREDNASGVGSWRYRYSLTDDVRAALLK